MIRELISRIRRPTPGLIEAERASERARADLQLAKDMWPRVRRVENKAIDTSVRLQQVYIENGFSGKMWTAMNTKGHPQ